MNSVFQIKNNFLILTETTNIEMRTSPRVLRKTRSSMNEHLILALSEIRPRLPRRILQIAFELRNNTAFSF